MRTSELPEPLEVLAGSRYWQKLVADPNHDDTLEYRVTRAPRGTELEVRGNELWFRIGPEGAAAHEQPFVLTVSDGRRSTELRESVYVYSPAEDHDWHFYLAPGFGYAAYAPLGGGPAYQGFRAELTYVGRRTSIVDRRRCQRAPEDYRCQVSHVRLFSAMEGTYPTSGDAGTLFAYTFGFTRSLESSPPRDFMIPHFSLEMGGMLSRSLPHLFQVTPGLGLHLFTRAPLWLDLTVGLRVVPQRLESLLGPHVSLTATLGPP